jgi:nucleotide-binding universal stress UspA family protein
MKILVPTDFSECADQAEKEAIRLSRALGGDVVLLHVGAEAPLYGEGLIATADVEKFYEAQRKWAMETLTARAEALREEGVAARPLLRVGAPAAAIVTTAREEGADYIVMGTHGRGGLNRLLLGSVADRVIRLAPCPVMTVRAPTAE